MYDAQVSAEIEAAWEGDLPSVRVRVRGTDYDIVFAEMKQRSAADPARKRAVKRIDDGVSPQRREGATPPAATSPATPAAAAPSPAPAPAATAPAPAGPWGAFYAAGAAKRKAVQEGAPAPNAPAAKAARPAGAASDRTPAAGDAPPQAPPAKKNKPPGGGSLLRQTDGKQRADGKKAPAKDVAAAPGGEARDAEEPAPAASAIPPEEANARIHEMLIELGETEKVKGDKTRANVYYRAASAVKAYDKPIRSGKQAKKELKGVGDKIAAKIDELLTTGTLARLERERTEPQAVALRELQRVSGIGPVFAQELYDKWGIHDLVALTLNQEHLSREQKIGLRYVREFESKIPRAEMAQLEAVVARVAATHVPPLECTVCGSYRRGKAASGDIDVLLRGPGYVSAESAEPDWLSTLVRALEAEDFITDVISLGRKKCAAVCRSPGPAAEAPAPAVRGADSASSAAASSSDASAGAKLRLPSWKEVEARKAGRRSAYSATLFGARKELPAANTDWDQSAPFAYKAAAPPADDAPPQLPDRLHRRIDLRLVPSESYATSMLYFTGSGEFNKWMRGEALAHQPPYKLSEYGLFRQDVGADGAMVEVPVRVESEAEVFALLGIDYRPPEKREM